MTIKVFQVGNYPQGRWGLERVWHLVDAYNPEGGIEAPCVVGRAGRGGSVSIPRCRYLGFKKSWPERFMKTPEVRRLFT